MALYFAVPHSNGFTLGRIAFVCGVAVGVVIPFWTLSSLYLLRNVPYVSCSFSCSLLRAAAFQPAAATAAIARACLTSAHASTWWQWEQFS
jgi:hypothetical protein